MHIRAATIKDIAELSELFRQAAEYNVAHMGHYELEPNFDWAAYAGTKLRNGHERIFVAENDDGSLAGFIDCRIIIYPGRSCRKPMFGFASRKSGTKSGLPLKPSKWGVIDECYVIPSLRRQGIGNDLVAGAVTWFKAENISRIELSVIAGNRSGEAFWKKYGFGPFRTLLVRTI